MTEKPWTIRVHEEVSLHEPGGRIVAGLPHKVSGLLAALALLAPEPITRAAAGSILWPQASSEQQQTSLRQALTALRRHTGGASFLAATRASVSLDSSRIHVERAPSAELLRSFAEPWFVLFRSSESAARLAVIKGSSGPREATAVRSLEDLLDWTIRHQPAQAYGLIRHAVDLATSLPPHRALLLSKELLRRGPINHPLRGWANLLQAYALFYCLETDVARQAFHDLRLAAVSRGDAELMAMSGFFEAGTLLSLGELDRADAVLAQCTAMSAKKRTPRGAIRLTHGLGLAACCRGDYARGLKLLNRAIESAVREGEEYEVIYSSANTAWIASSVGHTEAARSALQQFELLDAGDHWRFQLTADLARIHLACSDGDPSAGLTLGEALLAQTKRIEAPSFEIYVREGMARCYALLGKKEDAKREIVAAARIREQINWTATPWDADRLVFARSGKLA